MDKTRYFTAENEIRKKPKLVIYTGYGVRYAIKSSISRKCKKCENVIINSAVICATCNILKKILLPLLLF